MNRKQNEQTEMDEDTLWTIARLEVISETNGTMRKGEYKLWNSDTRLDAWQDSRYSGILECQYDNYRAGTL